MQSGRVCIVSRSEMLVSPKQLGCLCPSGSHLAVLQFSTPPQERGISSVGVPQCDTCFCHSASVLVTER